MRTSSALLAALALAACDRTPDANVIAAYEAAADEDKILCARGPDRLARDCTIDRQVGQDGLLLTVRHPDGAFHRLLVTRDGRGVVAADGAQPAKVSVLGADGIEIALGDARYRLPATVKGR